MIAFDFPDYLIFCFLFTLFISHCSPQGLGQSQNYVGFRLSYPEYRALTGTKRRPPHRACGAVRGD
jgi:hypothetical protein